MTDPMVGGNVDTVIHQLASPHSPKPNQGRCTPYSDQTRLKPAFLSSHSSSWKTKFFLLCNTATPCSFSCVNPFDLALRLILSCTTSKGGGAQLTNGRIFSSSCNISCCNFLLQRRIHSETLYVCYNKTYNIEVNSYLFMQG